MSCNGRTVNMQILFVHLGFQRNPLFALKMQCILAYRVEGNSEGLAWPRSHWIVVNSRCSFWAKIAAQIRSGLYPSLTSPLLPQNCSNPYLANTTSPSTSPSWAPSPSISSQYQPNWRKRKYQNKISHVLLILSSPFVKLQCSPQSTTILLARSPSSELKTQCTSVGNIEFQKFITIDAKPRE